MTSTDSGSPAPDAPAAPKPAPTDSPEAAPEPPQRLFIAIPLPGAPRREIEKLRSNLQTAFEFTPCNPAWAYADTFHLTLRFLGDTPPAQVPDLAEEFAAIVARHPAPRLRGFGVGCFPDLQRPRVLWTGIRDKTDRLKPLQAEIEQLAVRHGFKRENRPWHGHITLARFRSMKGTFAVKKIVAAHEDFRGQPFVPSQALLYRSYLSSEGARHEPVRRADFSAS